MSPHRPRLVIPSSAISDRAALVDALGSQYDVVEVESTEDAVKLASESGGDLMLLDSDLAIHAADRMPLIGVTSVLEHIGEGVGVIDSRGALTYSNARLRKYKDPVRQSFVRICVEAMRQFNNPPYDLEWLRSRPGERYEFDYEDRHFEVLVSIAAMDEHENAVVTAVVGMLWEITEAKQLQRKLDAIDAAGAELLRVETASVAKLNMAERLKLLEDRIVGSIKNQLEFDNFEIRLIDRESNLLELVIAKGISPLKIGEVFYAERKDSGISGYVAATGQSYLCDDTAKDPLYREGLEDASSSLTVPLRLHERVIGVFNVESNTANAFDDNDRRFAEIFGRYIAMALHILDLLVVERFTTSAQVTETFLTEVRPPLRDAADAAARLRKTLPEGDHKELASRLLESMDTITRRLEACSAGPRSLLGAEQEMHREEPDPAMQGKRVLLADNEPGVRDAIAALLAQKGCEVVTRPNGSETIELLQKVQRDAGRFDLVISDIRMPDRNGYEVFRATKEIDEDTPVILITGFGYDPHHSIVRASQEGLHSFLFKPLKATQLLDAVSSALRDA